MVDKAAPNKKKDPEVEKTVIEEEDLFEDFAVEDGRFRVPLFSINYSVRLLLSMLTQSNDTFCKKKYMHLQSPSTGSCPVADDKALCSMHAECSMKESIEIIYQS